MVVELSEEVRKKIPTEILKEIEDEFTVVDSGSGPRIILVEKETDSKNRDNGKNTYVTIAEMTSLVSKRIGKRMRLGDEPIPDDTVLDVETID